MKPSSKHHGFTLIELMISVGIIAVLASFAIPAYQGYLETSALGVLAHDISTIAVFQEDLMLRTGTYAQDLADLEAITAATGWDPRTEGVEYSIAASDGTFYDVTANDGEHTHCLRFPAGTACP